MLKNQIYLCNSILSSINQKDSRLVLYFYKQLEDKYGDLLPSSMIDVISDNEYDIECIQAWIVEYLKILYKILED